MPTKRLRPKSFCNNVTFGGGFVGAVVARKQKDDNFNTLAVAEQFKDILMLEEEMKANDSQQLIKDQVLKE